jgi:hypothetical protein
MERIAMAPLLNDHECESGRRQLFDQDFPSHEQLPRWFQVEFSETLDGDAPTVVVRANGDQIGDPLTDNSYRDDGYRYHDVFHFANAAVLGWSPMARTLFGCKRRSNPQTAIVEDGGRAKVLEEVVCALIFDFGQQHDFEVKAAEIDNGLIATLRRLTADREVSQICDDCWRELIESSIVTWKAMRQHRGGILEGDLNERRIRFVPMSS